MTRDEKCRFLWENVLQQCWHEDADGIKGHWHTCDKCGERFALGSFLVDPPRQYDFDPFTNWSDAHWVFMATKGHFDSLKLADEHGDNEYGDNEAKLESALDAAWLGAKLEAICDAVILASGGAP